MTRRNVQVTRTTLYEFEVDVPAGTDDIDDFIHDHYMDICEDTEGCVLDEQFDIKEAQ
jgi:hypothetical protein